MSRAASFSSRAADELEQVLANALRRLDERDAQRTAEGTPPTPALTPTKILMRDRHLHSVP